jgi:GTP cyclohydrolase I
MRDQKLARATELYRQFMKEVGLSTDGPETVGTPERVARMFLDEWTLAYKPLNAKLTTFPFHGDQYVAVHAIPVSTLCAHHHLPVYGTVDIVYHPSGSIIGLSKIPRIIEHIAGKPVSQEFLTEEIADYIYNLTFCHGIYVRMRATHTCMTVRGVKTDGVTTTAIVRGTIDKQECMEHLR